MHNGKTAVTTVCVPHEASGCDQCELDLSIDQCNCCLCSVNGLYTFCFRVNLKRDEAVEISTCTASLPGMLPYQQADEPAMNFRVKAVHESDMCNCHMVRSSNKGA